MIKVFQNRIKGFNLFRSILVSQSESRAKIHSCGEIPIADIRDDDETNVLNEGVLLLVRDIANDDKTVKVMYQDGKVNILPVWKLKITCTEVIKVFDTDTTISNDLMFLSK